MMGGNSGGMPGANGMGSPIGGMGMDLAPYKMPLIGGFFQDPNELHQKQQAHNMAVSYAAYRPEAQQSQMNAVSNLATMFQPYQNAMAEMYGPNRQMQIPTNSPVSSRAQTIGNPMTGSYNPPHNQPVQNPFR